MLPGIVAATKRVSSRRQMQPALIMQESVLMGFRTLCGRQAPLFTASSEASCSSVKGRRGFISSSSEEEGPGRREMICTT